MDQAVTRDAMAQTEFEAKYRAYRSGIMMRAPFPVDVTLDPSVIYQAVWA